MKPPIKVDLLWFEDCPNHLLAFEMICQVGAELGIPLEVEQIEVPDEATGLTVRFPGSPTIRVNGVDIEPGFDGCDDCTPRCRVYLVEGRLTGIPARHWVNSALIAASDAAHKEWKRGN